MKEQEAKETIKTLEMWLRNLIDISLTNKYGADYFQAKDDSGKNIIKSKIRYDVERRISGNKNRYPRIVDALLLDEEIEIVCNPVLYKKYFNNAFKASYSGGNNELRTYLQRITPIRNKLFHSNPISMREYEKVICYSHDAIDAIKKYYKEVNIKKEYNVPSILSIKDSLGNIIYENQFLRIKRSRGVCPDSLYSDNILHVGDKLEIFVDIDESFPKDTYKVKWLHKGTAGLLDFQEQLGHKFSLKISEAYIREQFKIECIVISNKQWHRFTSHDDLVVLNYKILPIM